MFFYFERGGAWHSFIVAADSRLVRGAGGRHSFWASTQSTKIDIDLYSGKTRFHCIFPEKTGVPELRIILLFRIEPSEHSFNVADRFSSMTVIHSAHRLSSDNLVSLCPDKPPPKHLGVP